MKFLKQPPNLNHMHKKAPSKTYTVELSEEEAEIFETVVSCWRDWNDKPLSPEAFLAMLVDDVILTHKRPGSWEGSNMHDVLISHFPNFEDAFALRDEKRDELREALWLTGEYSFQDLDKLTLPCLREMKQQADEKRAELDRMLEDD